jgi:hypothetical protein
MKLSTLLARLRPASVPHIFKEQVGAPSSVLPALTKGGTAVGLLSEKCVVGKVIAST